MKNITGYAAKIFCFEIVEKKHVFKNFFSEIQKCTGAFCAFSILKRPLFFKFYY